LKYTKKALFSVPFKAEQVSGLKTLS